jgi:protein required for attachment to host cells
MSMHESCIWVLVAGRDEARIYSSADGVYDLNAVMPDAAGKPSILDGTTFSGFVAAVLRDGAREGAYDGLILVAPPDVARDLRHAMGPDIAPLVIGEISQSASAGALHTMQHLLTPQTIQ